MNEDNLTNKEVIKAIKDNYPPENYTILRKALDIAIKTLTPPTQEEVCEALSEYYCSARVIFIENEFMVDDIEEYHEDITKYNNAHNTYAIVVALPPKLGKMIFAFYEGLEATK